MCIYLLIEFFCSVCIQSVSFNLDELMILALKAAAWIFVHELDVVSNHYYRYSLLI